MNGNVRVKYRRNQLFDYVSEILALGECGFFFRGSFAYMGECAEGCFETEGYRRLSSLKEIGTEDILSIAVFLLQGVMQGERNYLFAERYAIDCDTVFVDKSISNVKLIYTPPVENTELMDKMILLLQNLRCKGHEEGYDYIDHAIGFMTSEGYNLRAVISYIESLRREVYLCSIL